MTKLHKEGKNIIPVALVIIAGLVWLAFLLNPATGWVLSMLGGILAIIIINFFRNPEVAVKLDEDKILAPCDGRVVVIEEVEDKIYFKQTVKQISIFMSPLNVHVNRNPISGTIRYLKYNPGKYLMAFNPKSSELNEHTYIAAENSKVSVAYKQIAGFLARRIKWYVQENEEVEQGAEYGFIRFGSRIDILMPTSCKVLVSLGDKTRAGQTILAEI